MSRSLRLSMFGAAALSAALSLPATARTASDHDPYVAPLDQPSLTTRHVTTTQLSGITRAGDRLVAVGVRGLIVVSDDQGHSWKQVGSPVSSDLLAVQFPTPLQGWIVGHDGVVLHSDDGGKSWTKQFDGNAAYALSKTYYGKLAEAGNPVGQQFVQDADLNYGAGPEQALLSLWFTDENNGFVCGSFGTLFATHDGGKSWEPWADRVDVDEALHYNAIRGIGGNIYIASEKGTVLKLDAEQQRFVPTAPTGYNGTLFNLAGDAGHLYAFGMRGNAFVSTDAGASWQAIDTRAGAALNAGLVTDDGRLLLVTQNGGLVASTPGGGHFTALAVANRTLLVDLALASPDTVALVGTGGVQLAKIGHE